MQNIDQVSPNAHLCLGCDSRATDGATGAACGWLPFCRTSSSRRDPRDVDYHHLADLFGQEAGTLRPRPRIALLSRSVMNLPVTDEHGPRHVLRVAVARRRDLGIHPGCFHHTWTLTRSDRLATPPASRASRHAAIAPALRPTSCRVRLYSAI